MLWCFQSVKHFLTTWYPKHQKIGCQPERSPVPSQLLQSQTHTMIWSRDWLKFPFWLSKGLLNCTVNHMRKNKYVIRVKLYFEFQDFLTLLMCVVSWICRILFSSLLDIFETFLSSMSVAPITAECPNHFTSLSWWKTMAKMLTDTQTCTPSHVLTCCHVVSGLLVSGFKRGYLFSPSLSLVFFSRAG